jgi:hypothetical protein
MNGPKSPIDYNYLLLIILLQDSLNFNETTKNQMRILKKFILINKH